MDVLVKNNVNFAYPFKLFLFPFLTTGIIKISQLPKVQSTVLCCGTVTGNYKHYPIWNCSQCLVEVKYENPQKLGVVNNLYKSNPILKLFTKNEVRLACRTFVDDDMYVITYCDDTKSRGYILVLIAFVVVYGCYLYFFTKKNNTKQDLDFTEKDLEDWINAQRAQNKMTNTTPEPTPSSTAQSTNPPIVTITPVQQPVANNTTTEEKK